ncbi:MAG: aminoglycoside phosphotransferase family protein [Clostridium argentinense]|uniref:Aminoglycoside phosphotransferase family protein n=1 Tax=Clostridium faecium TaxID=2762223 RepID=A0ABR8YQI9_9CLOT|nr:aminoglycoside phosphotransferase family protein [Clostridium faecium]MBD8046271.1 aminoglycoside phosphotransferase family protein [Clostridium faecium]MBS5824224.1 aminoglycoside phosphotransferase family protein [Clostridium argentinense]
MELHKLIAEGNTAKLYRWGDKAVKLFHKEAAKDEAYYEAAKQEYAYNCGLPVPKVYNVTLINGRQGIVMEYIEGESLGSLIYKDMKQAEYYMGLAIETQMKIHAVTAGNFQPMSERLKEKINAAIGPSNITKQRLINKMNEISRGNNLCHGDCHLFNFIKAKDKIVIIDWVDSSCGSIAADVYRSYLLYLQFSVDLAELYLRIYCEKSHSSKEEIFLWAPILACARLTENVSYDKAKQLIEIVNQYSSE